MGPQHLQKKLIAHWTKAKRKDVLSGRVKKGGEE